MHVADWGEVALQMVTAAVSIASMHQQCVAQALGQQNMSEAWQTDHGKSYQAAHVLTASAEAVQ